MYSRGVLPAPELQAGKLIHNTTKEETVFQFPIIIVISEFTIIRILTVYFAGHAEGQAMFGDSSAHQGYGSIDDAAGGGFNPRASGMHVLLFFSAVLINAHLGERFGELQNKLSRAIFDIGRQSECRIYISMWPNACSNCTY